MGVTQQTLSGYLGRPATTAEVDALTREVAVDVYRKLFWVGLKIERFPVWAREVMFNAACGSQVLFRRMIAALQSVVGAAADGAWGPKSELLAALATQNKDNRELRNALVHLLIEEYIKIAVGDASQNGFCLGWYRRGHSLFDFGY